jgi:hypothetical protein
MEMMTMARKPAVRTKDDQVSFRVDGEVKEGFDQRIKDLGERVLSVNGGPILQGQLLSYFMAWFQSIPLDEAATAARLYRRASVAEMERREETRTQQPCDAASHTVGGHTVGRAVSLDEVLKPAQARPAGRTDRKKMFAEPDR